MRHDLHRNTFVIINDMFTAEHNTFVTDYSTMLLWNCVMSMMYINNHRHTDRQTHRPSIVTLTVRVC